MGKGDIKTGKGKRARGSYGKTRQPVSKKLNQAAQENLKKKAAADKKATKKEAAKPVEAKTAKAETKKEVKKAPAKKAAAKKAPAKEKK